MLLHPDAELIRTRDMALIAQSDFAMDVGGEWDAMRGRFDHHQRGFAGARASGVVYASAGLVWTAYGAALVEQTFGLGDAKLAQSMADVLANFRKAVGLMTTLLTATLDQLRAKHHGAELAQCREMIRWPSAVDAAWRPAVARGGQ